MKKVRYIYRILNKEGFEIGRVCIDHFDTDGGEKRAFEILKRQYPNNMLSLYAIKEI